MRLYPPVWVMIRRAVEACEIAGHPVPAGPYVAVSAYSTQRHPYLRTGDLGFFMRANCLSPGASEI